MITVEEAKHIILSNTQDFGTEEIPFLESVGRILKEDIIVGEKEGDKQVEGDLKTPEGAYMLTKKLTHRLHPYHVYRPLRSLD